MNTVISGMYSPIQWGTLGAKYLASMCYGGDHWVYQWFYSPNTVGWKPVYRVPAITR